MTRSIESGTKDEENRRPAGVSTKGRTQGSDEGEQQRTPGSPYGSPDQESGGGERRVCRATEDVGTPRFVGTRPGSDSAGESRWGLGIHAWYRCTGGVHKAPVRPEAHGFHLESPVGGPKRGHRRPPTGCETFDSGFREHDDHEVQVQVENGKSGLGVVSAVEVGQVRTSGGVGG